MRIVDLTCENSGNDADAARLDTMMENNKEEYERLLLQIKSHKRKKLKAKADERAAQQKLTRRNSKQV